MATREPTGMLSPERSYLSTGPDRSTFDYDQGYEDSNNLPGTSLTTPYGQSTNPESEFQSFVNPHGGGTFIGTRADGTRAFISREQAMQAGYVPRDRIVPTPYGEPDGFESGIDQRDRVLSDWEAQQPGMLGSTVPGQEADAASGMMAPTYTPPPSQAATAYSPAGRNEQTGWWQPTVHDGEYNATYSLDFATQRLNDTHGAGDNTQKKAELSQWFTDTNVASQRSPEEFGSWVESNPEEAIRYYALAAQPRWNGAADDPAVAKENQAMADSLAYFQAIEQGYGKDGTKDGKMIASNFSTFNDLTNEGGPGDVWKLGKASSLPGGINDFVEDNPLQAIGMVGMAVLAPYASSALVAAGYSTTAAGAIVGAGSGAINQALAGGDVSDIIKSAATGGALGGATGWASGQAANISGGGDSILGLDQVAEVSQEVVEGSTIMDKVVDAVGGIKDVLISGSKYEPWGEVKAPTIGGTTVGSKDGWHWEVNDEGVFRAVQDRPDMEEGGGGSTTTTAASGGVAGNQVPYEYSPGDNPSGSTGSGLGGELEAQGDGEVAAGEDKDLSGMLLGLPTFDSGSSNNTGGTVATTSPVTTATTNTGGTGTGTGTGTGEGTGEGEGGGDGDGLGMSAAIGMLAAGGGKAEFSPFMAQIKSDFPLLSKLNLGPSDYLKMLMARMNS